MEFLIAVELCHKIKHENETAIKVSFWVADSLAKQGKLVTDGELIKSYLFAAAKEMCPEKINFFKTINSCWQSWGHWEQHQKSIKKQTNDLSGFPWLLMSQQMLPILLSCLSEESMQSLKWLKNSSLWIVCMEELTPNVLQHHAS